MTIDLQDRKSSNRAFRSTSMACAADGGMEPPRTAAISALRKNGFWECLLTVCCGASLAVGLTGCGSYSSSGSTYTTPTTPSNSSPALWVANGANVLEFSSTALTTAGSAAPAPTLILNSSVFASPQGVLFDTSSNLWVVDGGTISTGGKVKPALYQFTSANLTALQSPATGTPNVAIGSPAFVFPQQAVFDSKGDLWVSDNGANAIFEFMPSQLMASGTAVEPNITIKSDPAFNGPLGIAFDSSGDLWIANNGTTTIFEFKAAALPTAGGSMTLAPSVILTDDGKQSIQGPWALAFDSSGNLWSSNANSPNTVVQFSKASLAITGSPTPSVTLSSAMVSGNASLNAPNGIAFDKTGDLAVVNSATPFGVGLYSASQLTAGGAVAPNVFIVGAATTLNLPAGDTFGPTIVYGTAGTYSSGPTY
ncbi:MAG: hypothetical protein ACLGQX_04560 [Acidobacteriota bacterium]